MGPVQTALKAIDKYASPEDKKKLKLIVAEYGPFDWGGEWPFINNMGYNLANFEITGDQLLEPRIEFSCFWNTRWIDNDSVPNSVFDALDKKGNFNANGLGLMIWGNYTGKKMVRTTGTLNIRSFASYSPDESCLYVHLLNKNLKPSYVKLMIGGHFVEKVQMCGQLTSKSPDDEHPVWNDHVSLSKKDLKNFELPGTSISVLKLKLI
jgi:hypothetical protein